jgi:hemoglobin
MSGNEQAELPSPYELLGGRDVVTALSERFYDHMEAHEPELAKLHRTDSEGRIDRGSRDRFALFFVGWLGGPQDYVAAHGHPRLRMRHARVEVDVAMRDAWMRAMGRALDAQGVTGEPRVFLESKLGDLATFLRNQPG